MRKNLDEMPFDTAQFIVQEMDLSNEEAGALVRLMCCQHQHGHMTQEEMKIVVQGDVPESVMERFKKDRTGKFFLKRCKIATRSQKDCY